MSSIGGARSKEVSLIDGSLPQVNLLPPEIEASRLVARLKIFLLLAIVAAIAIVGLLFLWSTTQVNDAQERLDNEQTRTTSLQAELATYSKVTVVKEDLANISLAAWLSTSSEIEWFSYLEAVHAVSPPEVSYDSLVINATTPVSKPNPPQDPLNEAGFGTIQFVGRMPSTQVVTDLVLALEGIPGVSHVTYTYQQLTGDEDNGEYFEFEATIHITDAAVTDRLLLDSEGADS